MSTVERQRGSAMDVAGGEGVKVVVSSRPDRTGARRRASVPFGSRAGVTCRVRAGPARRRSGSTDRWAMIVVVIDPRPLPVRFGLFLSQADRSWAEVLARFAEAEALGFDHAWLVDHLHADRRPA